MTNRSIVDSTNYVVRYCDFSERTTHRVEQLGLKLPLMLNGGD
jgi:hypothetical protein